MGWDVVWHDENISVGVRKCKCLIWKQLIVEITNMLMGHLKVLNISARSMEHLQWARSLLSNPNSNNGVRMCWRPQTTQSEAEMQSEHQRENQWSSFRSLSEAVCKVVVSYSGVDAIGWVAGFCGHCCHQRWPLYMIYSVMLHLQDSLLSLAG